MTDTLTIRPAQPGDLPAMIALLSACQEPAKDLGAETLFHVAETGAGQLVGAVGLEKKGRRGLLRSLAVAPAFRRRGLGEELLGRIESMALVAGISHLYLLTESAPDFFLRRDYQRISPAAVPTDVFSRDQSVARRAAAACLGKKL